MTTIIRLAVDRIVPQLQPAAALLILRANVKRIRRVVNGQLVKAVAADNEKLLKMIHNKDKFE